MTYEVYVNFAGYIGADEPYNVDADSEEEAVILAEAEAKDDLSVESIEDLGDGEYLVTVSFCDFIGVEEEYKVYADNESDAKDEAIEEASWDLSGEVTDTLDELDEGFISGIGYVDPMTVRHWQEQDDEYERTHPDEKLFDTITDDELVAQGAIRAKDAKVGDLIRVDFDQSERSIHNDPELLYDYKIVDIDTVNDDGIGTDITIVTDDGQRLHYDNDDLIGWLIDPADLPAMRADAAKNDLKTYESYRVGEGDMFRYNYGTGGLDPALPSDAGKIAWQRYLFPSLKQCARDMEISDTNILVSAVRNWLNRH